MASSLLGHLLNKQQQILYNPSQTKILWLVHVRDFDVANRKQCDSLSWKRKRKKNQDKILFPFKTNHPNALHADTSCTAYRNIMHYLNNGNFLQPWLERNCIPECPTYQLFFSFSLPIEKWKIWQTRCDDPVHWMPISKLGPSPYTKEKKRNYWDIS